MFSKNKLPTTQNKQECGIINLDDHIGPGTHWTCYYDNYYFDPFGLSPPKEVLAYISNIKYNTIQYQDKTSVLCGYFCLFFIKKLQQGNSVYDILYKILKPYKPIENENIIKSYFVNQV